MKLVSTFVAALIFAGAQCSLLAGPVQMAGKNGAEIFVYTNHLSMLRGEREKLLTNTFEVFIGVSDLPRDLVTNVWNEIQCDAFRQLVAEQDGSGTRPRYREFICLEDDMGVESLVAAFTSWPETNGVPVYKRFRKRVEFYMHGRFAGHSTNYLYQAIQESKSTNLAIPFGFPMRLKYEMWVPVAWTNHIINDLYGSVVVDGPLAWKYSSDGIFFQKRDAKEFDPQYKAQFESAGKEAQEILDKKGVVYIDSTANFDAELQKILKKKFNIDWLTPMEIDQR